MSPKVVKLLLRGIIRHLDGNGEKATEYTKKAWIMHKNTCICGGWFIPCRYGKRPAQICTYCGLLVQDGYIVRKCIANSKKVG